MQSVLSPASGQASLILQLWWLMLWISIAVLAVVLAFVAIALHATDRTRAPEDPVSESRLSRSVATAVALTTAILFGLLTASVWTGRSMTPPEHAAAIIIDLAGHQWWWEVEYEAQAPNLRVRTANEIHIPVNRPVVLNVTSRDVIHSFWVPNLQGKRDLIPGTTTSLRIQANRPGHFRGQCAEFCGLQHAHMALDVVVESEAAFAEWVATMRRPAAIDIGQAEQRGREVFMTARCSGCHTILGTEAHGQLAPDLTHLARRGTLGAGTLPNTPEHLRAWVLDPQASKPGNQMPPNPLSSDQVDALVAYLGTLR